MDLELRKGKGQFGTFWLISLQKIFASRPHAACPFETLKPKAVAQDEDESYAASYRVWKPYMGNLRPMVDLGNLLQDLKGSRVLRQ